MKTDRSINISVLNVAMHKPHSPLRYFSLLRDAKRLNALIELGSLHGAILGSVNGPSAFKPGTYLTGEIYRFVNLDASEPWFNLKTSEAASPDEMGSVVIPKHLLPHLQRIEYVFRLDNHRLWFISQDRKDRLGPQAAAKFFQLLFDRVHSLGKCPQTEVTALPDLEQLDTILSLHKLERITIDLKRPNADDAAGEEARLLKRLEQQHIRRQETVLVASAGDTITPDAETRLLAEVASRNGSVSVVGKDASGLRVKESTTARPLVMTQRVNSEIETSLDVLTRVALEN